MGHNPLAQTKNSLLFWTATLALATVQVLVLHHFYQWLWWPLIVDAVVHWLLLGLLIFGLFNSLSFYHPAKGKWVLALLVPALLVTAWWALSRWILEQTAGYGFEAQVWQDYLQWFYTTQAFRLAVGFLLTASATLYALLWYQLAQKEQQVFLQNETEAMKREAELFKLRQQIQPHFLFNSLNSVVALIGQKPTEARAMVQNLSDFYRSTLSLADESLIALSAELSNLQQYLSIEQVRFGHRLKADFQTSPAAEKALLPPLILQPLLENALKFGLYGTTNAVTISITAEVEGGYLKLEVTNPFEEDYQAASGTGFGLKAVNRRLFLLYGSTQLLRVQKEDRQFLAQLKIPQK